MTLQRKRRTPLLVGSMVLLAIGSASVQSGSFRHFIHRVMVKTEMRISAWRGFEPHLASIAGESGLPGARVQALDSRSGWATLCDRQGRFVLPDVMWYPGASYDLILSTDERTGRRIHVSAPPNPAPAPSATSAPTGILEVGTLASDGREVDLAGLHGDTSNSYEAYDVQNRDYYRTLYDELTSAMVRDEDKVEAVNAYVSQKLNYSETQWELGSARRILERGSQYCGHLATAMATIVSVRYRARVIHLSDGAAKPATHVVVEVFYKGEWHLYDPTFGVSFTDKAGRVVSYRELRLNPALISQNSFVKFRKQYPKISLKWMPGVYESGYHHMYYLTFRCSQYSHAWWDYKDGLNYVPSGGAVLLAAAGVRPGSRIRFHIRTPGSDADALTFTTRRTSNACCVVNEQESPPIELAPGSYDVYVDLLDGNVRAELTPAAITGWRLAQTLQVR